MPFAPPHQPTVKAKPSADADAVGVPADVPGNLAAFRRWVLSDDAPDSGRIDFINGSVEIDDMAGEDFITHGRLKGTLFAIIWSLIEALDFGYVNTDSTRVSAPAADLSAEPDVIVVSYDALDAGRVRLVPKASGEAGRYWEVEGPPDLVVEVLSDSTTRKDTQRLPAAYFAAGVAEFWLADGRGATATLTIHRRGSAGFEPMPVDAEGFQTSDLLRQNIRLDQSRDRRGEWRYDLVCQ